MTDNADLIRRLRAYAQERYLGSRCPNLVHEAADAIRELVADYKGQGEALIQEVNAKLEAQRERDAAEEAVSAATDLKQKWRDRAGKAEKALRLWAGAGESSTETIERLVAERDDALQAASVEVDCKRKAEADLATAREALEEIADGPRSRLMVGFSHGRVGRDELENYAIVTKTIAQDTLAAIAAARAKGGE